MRQRLRDNPCLASVIALAAVTWPLYLLQHLH
jgi:hypothetical protein